MLRCEPRVRSGILAAALLAAAPGAAAQEVSGRVLQGAGEPVRAAFIVLLDATGAPWRATLTDSAGAFALAAPAAGSYRLRAEALGLHTLVTDTFTLAAGAIRDTTLMLAIEPVPLPALTALGENRCRLRPAAGEATARVWDEVRKALHVSAWVAAQPLDYRVRRRERFLDMPLRFVRSDSTTERSVPALRPYASLPPEELLRGGYVRRDSDGYFVYYGPDEATLASDAFLDGHCLQLAQGKAGRERLLGVAFRPVSDRGPADIAGTVWVAAATGELRAIDFDYTLPVRVPRGAAGGRVEYSRLPTGAWIVRRWRLSFPEFTREPRAGPWEPPRVVIGALHETYGEVLAVSAPALREGFRPEPAPVGAVAGMVWDSVHGRPATGARVELVGTQYAAHADSAGRFRIADVPPGRYAAAFRHPVLDSLPIGAVDAEVVVDSGREALLDLATPSLGTALARACPSVLAESALIFGRLLGGARPGVVIEVIFERTIYLDKGPPVVARVRTLEVEPASDGTYRLCGIRPEWEVIMRSFAPAEDRRSMPRRLRLAPGQMLRVDLPPPD